MEVDGIEFEVEADPETQSKLLSRLTEIFSKNRDEIHVSDLTLCFAPNSLVSTRNGWKAIQDIQVGEWVLTHRGRHMPVTRIFRRVYRGAMVQVKATHHPAFICTPDHLILTKQSRWGTWVKASDVSVSRKYGSKQSSSSNIAFVPELRPHGPSISIGEDMAKLAGIYLAEGYIDMRHGLGIGKLCFGKHEHVLIRETEAILNRLGKAHNLQVAQTSTVLSFGNADLFLQFYVAAPLTVHNKCLPPWIFCLPPEERKLIWEWYVKGDGHIRPRGSVEAHVTSPALADGFRLLLHSLGYKPSVSIVRQPAGQIEGRPIPAHVGFTIALNGKGAKYQHESRMKITTINNYNGPVYNLEVHEDNSYTVNGVAVHNCIRQSFFKRAIPKPVQPVTLGFFITGKGWHGITEMVYGEESEVMTRYCYPEMTIRNTPDIIELEGFPVELKTTRGGTAVKQHYIRQLAYACALRGMEEGKLWVLWSNPKKTGPIETLKIKLKTPLLTILEQIKTKYQMLCNALDEAKLNPEGVLETAARVTPAQNSEIWLCRNCQWRLECGAACTLVGQPVPWATAKGRGIKQK